MSEEVLEFLQERYPSATSLRALWCWAGGEEEALSFQPTLTATWSEVWERAGEAEAAPTESEEAAAAAEAETPENEAPDDDDEDDDEDDDDDDDGATDREGVTRLSLVREALYDAPGDPLLLEHLYEVASERCPALFEQVDFLLLALERLARVEALEPRWLHPALAAFPAKGWEEAFAAVAPALQEELGLDARAQLPAALLELADYLEGAGDAVAQLQESRALLRAAKEAKDEEAEAACLATELARFKALAGRLGQWDKKRLPLIATLQRGLDRLVKRIEFRRRPKASMAVASLTSFLVELAPRNARLAEGLARQGAVCRGVVVALRGTTPPEDELLQDEDDELEEVPVGDAHEEVEVEVIDTTKSGGD